VGNFEAAREDINRFWPSTNRFHNMLNSRPVAEQIIRFDRIFYEAPTSSLLLLLLLQATGLSHSTTRRASRLLQKLL